MSFFEEVIELNEKMIKCIQVEDFDSIDEMILRREEIIKVMEDSNFNEEVPIIIKNKMQEQDVVITSLFDKSMKQVKEDIHKIEQNKKANLRYNYVQNNYKKIYKKV